MKRILALILALLLCFGLLACKGEKKKEDKTPTQEQTPTEEQTQTEQKEQQSSQISPVLYKVTDEAGHAAYLLGSIHVGREDFYPLPDYVLDAFESADALAVEADVIAAQKDLAAQVEALKPLIYTDGTTIQDHIPEELYNDAVAVLEETGCYNSSLDHYIPGLWYSFIESAMYEHLGIDSNLGIDMFFLKKAYETDLPIVEIESVAFQFGMMAAFSEPLQIMLLEQSVRSAQNPEGITQASEILMNLWASGNAELFAAYVFAEGEMSEQEAPLYEEFNKEMITDRNLGMADYTEEALASGETVFVVVGAGHVLGEGGMADLLSQRGYTVEQVQ